MRVEKNTKGRTVWVYNIQNGKAVRYENNRFNDKKILLGDYLQAWLGIL